jgi:hypothetical protein
MTAKGTLNTADIVPSIATSAISLELIVADSNSKKKATTNRITRMVAISPQFTKFCNGDSGNRGIIKALTPITSIKARTK